jgi:hypothetical protein
MKKRVVTRESLLKQAHKIKREIAQMIRDAEDVCDNNPNCQGMVVSDLVDLDECKKMCDYADSIIKQLGNKP